MMNRKVLMLHGYGQNANIFRKRLAAFRKSCGDDIELVFVDAPHVLLPVDLDSFSANATESSETTADPTLIPRGWYKKIDLARGDYATLEASMASLKSVLSQNRFVGVFGFSQGAAMAALLTALLEKPHVHPSLLDNDKPFHPPFEFCVAVAGFKPAGPICAPLFEPSYSTLTLHVLGRTDVIVSEERSKTLLDVSSNKRVEWHDGGHFVPSQKQWRAFFRDFLLDPAGNTPSPGLTGPAG